MPDLAAIRDYVREQTLVEQDDFGDTKINTLINQGLRRLSVRFPWPWLATSTALNVLASTTSYSLPSDLLSIRTIVRDDKKQRLVEVAAHEILGPSGGDLPSGDPTSYYLHGNTLYLDKSPTSAIDYTMLYYQAASVMANDTDVPGFNDAFHLVLGDYAISKIWEREEDFTKADEAARDYASGVEEMAAFYLNRGGDAPIIFGESRPTTYRRGPNNMPWLSDAS